MDDTPRRRTWTPALIALPLLAAAIYHASRPDAARAALTAPAAFLAPELDLDEAAAYDHPHPDEPLLRGLLVCAWDIEWARPRLARLAASGTAPGRGTLVGLSGPGAIFANSAAPTALARHAELTGTVREGGSRWIATNSALRRPTDPVTRALALAFAGRPAAAHDRAALARLNASPGPTRSALALVEALTACRSDNPPPAVRALLVDALEEAAPGDPWPAHALATLDAAQGRPASAAPHLARRLARFPREEATAFALAWVHWRAGDRAQMECVLAQLESLGGGPEVPLVRAATALAAGQPQLAAPALRTLRRYGVPVSTHLPGLDDSALLNTPNDEP